MFEEDNERKALQEELKKEREDHERELAEAQEKLKQEQAEIDRKAFEAERDRIRIETAINEQVKATAIKIAEIKDKRDKERLRDAMHKDSDEAFEAEEEKKPVAPADDSGGGGEPEVNLAPAVKENNEDDEDE